MIATASNEKVADIAVGKGPVQVAFSSDGRFVYLSLNAENAVGKIDVAERKLVGKVAVGAVPIQVYVSPDRRHLVVANQGTEERPGTTISIVDTAAFSVVATVETGKGAHGVVIDPSSRHAYVTNIYDDDVAVVDLAERRVVTRVPVEDAPNGISFSPLAPPRPSRAEIEIMPSDDSRGEAMPGVGH